MIQIHSPGNTDYDKNGDMPIFPTKAEISATLNGQVAFNVARISAIVGKIGI